MRSPLIPADLPGYRSRSARFDDLVLATIELLERSLAKDLDGTEFAIEEVPPSSPAPWEHGVPLGRYFPPENSQPPRITIYRRPIEERARDAAELVDLLRDVLVEQVAHRLGRRPEEIDPGYRGEG